MKSIAKLLGTVTLCAASASAFAGLNQAAATNLKGYVTKNSLSCLSCHSITQKVVGPAWLDVAKKYHGDAKANAEVAKRIANGGSGLWGSVPMPPGMATPAQAKKLADMILDLYKP